MSTYIKTLIDENGDEIIPRTRTSAITTSDGESLEDAISSKIDKPTNVPAGKVYVSDGQGSGSWQSKGGGGGGASDWSDIDYKPFESIDTGTLKVENNVLKINTTDNAEGDNTKPITSSGVFTIVGNINALLSII